MNVRNGSLSWVSALSMIINLLIRLCHAYISHTVARTCSLIYIVLDVLKPLQHKRLIEKELEGFGIRLNKKPPNLSYRRKDKGGINLTATCPQSTMDLENVKAILSEYRIHNADIVLRYDATADDLIDVVEGNRAYIPCIYILNKIDQISIEVGIDFYRACILKAQGSHSYASSDPLSTIWTPFVTL